MHSCQVLLHLQDHRIHDEDLRVAQLQQSRLQPFCFALGYFFSAEAPSLSGKHVGIRPLQEEAMPNVES